MSIFDDSDARADVRELVRIARRIEATLSEPTFTLERTNPVVQPPIYPVPSFTEKMLAATNKLFLRVMRHRERYVKAWIAATGLRPEESVLVEKHMPNGDVVMYVRKREVGER